MGDCLSCHHPLGMTMFLMSIELLWSCSLGFKISIPWVLATVHSEGSRALRSGAHCVLRRKIRGNPAMLLPDGEEKPSFETCRDFSAP